MVGMWLGGHEPGNVNLFRIAKERGLIDTFNPWEVPVYEWVKANSRCGVNSPISSARRW